MGPNSGNASFSEAFKVMILVLDIVFNVEADDVILSSEFMPPDGYNLQLNQIHETGSFR
jgi:hypothetical protein